MFYAAPVIDRGGAFVFFVFLYSLFTFVIVGDLARCAYFLLRYSALYALSLLQRFILVGRGARVRGQEPQGEGSLRCAQVSPLLKVLSLAHVSQSETAQFCSAKHALPFPHFLSPMGRESLVWCSVLDVSRSDELRHNTRLTPLGERRSRKGERERETLRREGNASLRVSPLSLGCLSRIRAPRPMKFNIGQKIKNKERNRTIRAQSSK